MSALWVPILPLGAYRVAERGRGYHVLSREPMSRFARGSRFAIIPAIVVAIAAFGTYRHLRDPSRLARKRFDAALVARGADGLERLDAELTGPDYGHVDGGRRARAGAAIVELTAAQVPSPFTSAAIDQATRVVRRYQALPDGARDGVALDALLDHLDAWASAVASEPEAELVLRHAAVDVARYGLDRPRLDRLEARVSEIRLQLAGAEAADRPMDALAILADGRIDPATTAAMSHILEQVVDAPSLLDDAGADLDGWLDAVGSDDPLRARVTDARDRGKSGRAEAEADDVTPDALAAMQKARPWDQRVAVALARGELEAGKLDAAAARLRAFGPPGRLVRDGRFVLAQLAIARGDLDGAERLLTDLVHARVARFTAVAAMLDAAIKAASDRIDARLRAGDVPASLREKLNAATTTDEERQQEVMAWGASQVDVDGDVTRLRPAYQALADVVPMSLALGTVQLRRAQPLSGPARDALLQQAERTFLAIRTAAEGQPDFELGLAEIDARLGKSEESEAAFKALLDRRDPALSLAVARLYRTIGRMDRARQVATELQRTAPSPVRETAAMLLGVMADDLDDEERWYRLADANDPFVRVSLVEVQGARMAMQGKSAECVERYRTAAELNLTGASAANVTGYNNAAIDFQNAYACSGDPALLALAATSLERAYRAASDDAIVVANLEAFMELQADLRVLARRVDVRALEIGNGQAAELVSMLAAGSERSAILGELAADASWRRATDLIAQYEVLAPSSTRPYELAFGRATLRRDDTAAEAVLARMQQAKSLDTSDAAASRIAWSGGSRDAKAIQLAEAQLTRLEAVAARPRLDARTHAMALHMTGTLRTMLAVLRCDAATGARARADLTAATTMWPAIDEHGAIAGELIDEAALASPDRGRWCTLRRSATAAAALTDLTRASDALAAAIRGSATWSDVTATVRADATRPGLDDLRLLTLVGDASLAPRAAAARGDRLNRLGVELHRLSDPTDPSVAADEALLGAP
ncbi:MAG TPA: hypothetical protein VHE35_33315 [Kofleriaceae bacterium]|nr:hypothetical protein [Kofleriaceae bacterium]